MGSKTPGGDKEHTAKPDRPADVTTPRLLDIEDLWRYRRSSFADQRHDRAPRTFTPWLLLRYHKTDNGKGRPIPDNTVFWVSPDIWVESSDPLGNAVVGEQNIVHARVLNLGKALARPTRVDFYWADPSLGLGPGQMNFIGSDTVFVDYHRSKDVRVPWTPLVTGHHCLVVNTTAEINDPIEMSFHPRLDRHVGQRNIGVVHAAPGKPIQLSLGVNNLAPMLTSVRVTARMQDVVVNPEATARWSRYEIVNAVAHHVRGEDSRDIIEMAGFERSAPRVRSQLSDRTTLAPSREAHRFFAQLMGSAGRARESTADTSENITLHELTMQGFEGRQLDLELGVPNNGARGEFVVFHVMQQIAGLAVGGYTVIVEVAG
ncbi:MAG TPA: hypothetical protein VHI98_07415 [Vicinamibacterales bacterium]|nr:hypothetical protein [Vicinamibacterales bacterium]